MYKYDTHEPFVCVFELFVWVFLIGWVGFGFGFGFFLVQTGKGLLKNAKENADRALQSAALEGV